MAEIRNTETGGEYTSTGHRILAVLIGAVVTAVFLPWLAKGYINYVEWVLG
jgi:hypothetical protein